MRAKLYKEISKMINPRIDLLVNEIQRLRMDNLILRNDVDSPAKFKVGETVFSNAYKSSGLITEIENKIDFNNLGNQDPQSQFVMTPYAYRVYKVFIHDFKATLSCFEGELKNLLKTK